MFNRDRIANHDNRPYSDQRKKAFTEAEIGGGKRERERERQTDRKIFRFSFSLFL